MATLLSSFRPIGAIDNNLVDPSLDPTVDSPEISIAPANFAPGTDRGLIDGTNPRTISNEVSGATNDPAANAETGDASGASAWLYVFGQFVDHDLDLESVGTTDISVTVPAGDADLPAGSSIPLTRVITDPTTGTITNTVAGYLDLSQVYGSTTATADALRNDDGTLKTSAGDYLPTATANEPPMVFAGSTPGQFVSGDGRVTENPELTAVTTLFLREHNYWVGVLKADNPDWTGDQLYNMAKAITTAEYQSIIYNEYLPALIGQDTVGAYAGYDPTVSAAVSQEFSTAAFRVGHSQLSDLQTQISNDGVVTDTESLGQSFYNTASQDEADDGVNALLRDLSNDSSQQVDVYAVDGVRNLLAASPAQMDLIATDIQRERDVGLGTLNQTRTALGLTPYSSFDQLTSDQTVAANLQTAYGSIDNVDLFIGGLAENHAPGADVGQTFQAIIADQFNRLRAGDAYWWENEDFDPATKQTISQTTLGDILERDSGTTVQQHDVFYAQERHLSDVAATDPSAPQLVIGVDDDNAQISGGPADDTIIAGLGMNQIMSGGGGANVFVYDGSGRTDSISDFNPAVDKIQYQPAAGDDSLNAMLTSDPAANVTLSDLNNSTVLNIGGNTIALTGVQSSSLTSTNFVLPAGATVDMVQQPTSGHEEPVRTFHGITCGS